MDHRTTTRQMGHDMLLVTASEKAKLTDLEDDLIAIEKAIMAANQKAARISDIIDFETVAARLADARVEVKVARHSF